MKGLLIFLFCFSAPLLHAQELYVFTEPASNMPAKSLSTKLSINTGIEQNKLLQRYTPEVMLGINKKIMVHAATTFSNVHSAAFGWESVYLYGKYRFYSDDDVHQHFRMAAFAEGGISKNKTYVDELNVKGDVTGFQTGLIATKLVNKFAASGTVSIIRAYKKELFGHGAINNAVNYTLSAGYLVLPREYKSFDQLNFNVYTEFIAQQNVTTHTYFIDAAPAVQAIFNSNSKLSIGYQFQVVGNGTRFMRRGVLISFEHTFFNALKIKDKKNPL